MLDQIGIFANDQLAAGKVLGMDLLTVSSEDELGLLAGRLGTITQRGKCISDGARRAGCDVDVAALKHAAIDVRLVRGTLAKAVDSGRLVAKSGQELKRKFISIERLLDKLRYGVCDLYRVHR